MHCHFHLTNGNEIISDDTGIEVLDLETALCFARKAIQELRGEDHAASEEWRGWRLDVVCPEGSTLATICLGTPLQ